MASSSYYSSCLYHYSTREWQRQSQRARWRQCYYYSSPTLIAADADDADDDDEYADHWHCWRRRRDRWQWHDQSRSWADPERSIRHRDHLFRIFKLTKKNNKLTRIVKTETHLLLNAENVRPSSHYEFNQVIWSEFEWPISLNKRQYI